ncbi:hypothetical protein ILUMI_14592 [Ignelater luminosus]|uniref:PiggyBac transposable element-derived protein domain-containing protein n=1 Tax=Ignelater luminosus TaxID=2038154 RepID=A0A8K0CUM7_IGNLU|nr:hypothetical protein ILUMI_14592 [Ignelater luminosus]
MSQLREIPSGSEDSELSEDDTDELRFEPIAAVPIFRNLQVNGNDNDDGFSDTDDVLLAQIAGRSHLRTYNLKKPHRWGYKKCVLSGVSGFSYNFELFTGKQGNKWQNNMPDLGAASNVVVLLSSVVPRDVHHKIYYDNYFASISLVEYLEKRKIHSVATVRTNRLYNYKSVTEKEMRKMGRGSMVEETSFQNTNVRVVQWYNCIANVQLVWYRTHFQALLWPSYCAVVVLHPVQKEEGPVATHRNLKRPNEYMMTDEPAHCLV